MKIQGLIVPTITPYTNTGIDLSSLTNLLEFVIDGGVDSVFILGTTGEFQYLTLDEKHQIIEHSASIIQNRVPLLMGISAETIHETKALVKIAEECGAQALVLAPMFGKTSPSDQINTVISLSSLPIVLYNNPAIHESSNLPISIIKEYPSNPMVIGIKDSSGDWDYFQRLLELQGPHFNVVQGKEAMILPSLEAGTDGIVAGAANIIPALCKKVWLQQDQETMESILAIKAEIKQGFPDSISGYKQKLVQMGITKQATPCYKS